VIELPAACFAELVKVRLIQTSFNRPHSAFHSEPQCR
jgi:hypothetical protein